MKQPYDDHGSAADTFLREQAQAQKVAVRIAASAHRKQTTRRSN